MVAELGLPVLALLGLVGLLVGSFLNVVIVRMPAGESIVSPPSRCVACETPIKPWDNIPVLSWFLLRGRCRACGEEFGFAYVLVELGNAVLWVVAGLRFGASWALLPMLVLLSTLLAQSVIDLEHSRLLDKITFPVLGVSVVLVGLASVAEDEPSRVLWALVGAAIYSGCLFVTGLIPIRGKSGMGLGDVKLALLLGLFLGWLHPFLILVALMTAAIVGIAVGAVYWVVRRTSTYFPFGPWLVVGTLVALLWARSIDERYLLGIPAFLLGPGAA